LARRNCGNNVDDDEVVVVVVGLEDGEECLELAAERIRIGADAGRSACSLPLLLLEAPEDNVFFVERMMAVMDPFDC
jgi:hypothetical protein